MQILADKVIAAENYQPDFYLIIPPQFENNLFYDKLTEIFQKHKGSGAIFLQRSGKWKKLSDKKIADSNELRAELKNLLGAENVKIY